MASVTGHPLLLPSQLRGVGTLNFWLDAVNTLLPGRRRIVPSRTFAAGIVVCAVLAGCRLTSDADFSSPSYAEQNRAILELVPHGTTRQQAVAALKSEGVQGAFGVSESVYYCDLWDRGDGERWQLDVALFFDQSGRLYKVAPSQPDTGVAKSVSNAADTNAEISEPAVPSGSATTRRLSTSRIGRRTPFADRDDLK